MNRFVLIVISTAVLFSGCTSSSVKPETEVSAMGTLENETEAGETKYSPDKTMDINAELKNEEGEYYSFDSTGYRLRVEVSDASIEQITVRMTNTSESVFDYGEHTAVFMKRNNAEPVRIYPYGPEGTDIAYRDVKYSLQPGETVEKTYSLVFYHLEETGEGEYIFRIEGVNFEADDEVVEYELYSETHQKNTFDIDIVLTVKQ